MKTGNIRKGALAILVLLLCSIVWAEPEYSRYVFDPNQSTIIKTGGLAGVYETYTIRGTFGLVADYDANTAYFTDVDANYVWPANSLGELLEMEELVSTEVTENYITFENVPLPGGAYIELAAGLSGNMVHLTGIRTVPYPDGFQYDLDAIAERWANAWCVPQNATSVDEVAITVWGRWPDGCIPDDSSVQVENGDIYFQVFSTPGEFCPSGLVPWQLTETVGYLGAGTHNVYVNLDGGPWMRVLEFSVAGAYYVDGVNGNDSNDGLSLETAFATIQRGINEANDCDMVLVYPGIYSEAVHFDGKAITVQGVATEAGGPIIEAPMDYAVSFYSDEEPNSILKNFVVRNSFLAVFCAGASPTIRHLTVVDNDFGIAAYAGAEPDISNCIFYNNTDGDLFGCQAWYSFVQDESTDGLVGYWKFDEGEGTTAYDSAGTNDGTIYGATWTTGQVGEALDFDGVDDYVDCGSEPSLYPAELTLAAWISPRTAGEAGYGRIIANDKDGSIKSYSFSMDGNNLSSWLYLSEVPGGVATTDNPVPFNEWHYVSLTYNGSEVKIYADGIEKAANAGLSGAVPVGSEVCIGDGGALYRNFDGMIDDVRIYGRALSAEEVRQVYEYGLGPMFADPCNDDYHLLSERGRHWPAHDVWVLDDATSPCVDGGDPNENPTEERMPNGGRVNMGAFGGTAYASMSEWPMSGDISRDGLVNFKDIAIVAGEWLDFMPWAWNEAPEVSISSPDGSEMVPYNTIDPVIIEVDASDVDGEVVKVEFFANGSKVAEDTNGSNGWQGAWHPISDGDFTLTAEATDDDGASASSAAVEVTVGYVW